MTRRVQALMLAVLLVVFGVLLAWRAGWLRPEADLRPGNRSRGSGPGAGRDGTVDWAGLERLAGPGSRAGAVDLFVGVAPAPRKSRAVARTPDPPPPPPPPAAPVTPPAPPPEDPLAAVRKELASYRFLGYLQKTGDIVVFLAAGNDVFLVKRGDVLGRTRTVVVQDIREKEIFFLFPPDRRIRAVLKDNAPLNAN